MIKSKYYVSEKELTFNNHTFTATRVNNDQNGNVRYVIHGNDLHAIFGQTIPYQFKQYRGKWYSGGYIIQSFNLIHDFNLIEQRLQQRKERIQQEKLNRLMRK